MTKTLLTVSLTLALIGGSSFAIAQGTSGGKDKTAACAGCHGEDGNSKMPTFPKLAGQHPGYLVKQMQAFQSGSRISPMMAPMVTGLKLQDLQEIASFYAANKVSANPPPVLPANDDDDAAKTPEQQKAEIDALITKGGDLYRNGALTDEVSACIACHGSHAEGNKPASFPALHSQHPDYLIKSLADFKTGARNSSKENMMHMIAKKMSDEQIKAVAYYISTLK